MSLARTNRLRALQCLLRRPYSTEGPAHATFFGDRADKPKFIPARTTRPKPESISFFTGAESYQDKIIALEAACTLSRRELQASHVLPLPPSLKDSVPVARAMFKKREEMSQVVDLTSIRPTQYRRILILLNELHQLRAVARAFGQVQVEERLGTVLEPFERVDKDTALAHLQTSGDKMKLDEFGRSYALGKRKESAARVWVIRSRQSAPATTTSSTTVTTPTPRSTPPPEGSTFEPAAPTEISTSSILINNIPLAEYFTTPKDRECVTRPLKIAGVLGAFNVFALVRGGGTSGQAGAVAHGIAKALIPQAPETSKILSKASLTKRDPRMVERKKTGLAKARKAYTWVKR